MAIRSIEELEKEKIQIDLTGPNGNAYVLLGLAEKLAKQLDKDKEKIITNMTSGDYENLLKVFESEFGDYVDLYR